MPPSDDTYVLEVYGVCVQKYRKKEPNYKESSSRPAIIAVKKGLSMLRRRGLPRKPGFLCYCDLRATIGSTFAARRAGI